MWHRKNLIRVVRGAGAPDQIIGQLHTIAIAYERYVGVYGHEPRKPEVIAEMLRSARVQPN